jgi:hypothetical protein
MFARSPVGEPMPLEPLKNGQRAARHAATTPLRVPAPSLASTPPALCASSAAKDTSDNNRYFWRGLIV